MNKDTIYRQAAIDALNEGIEYIQRALDNMELVGDVRSKFEFGRMLLEACIDALSELPSAQLEQRWISSDEKPPEEGSYLVWMPFAPPKNRIAVAKYCGEYWNIKTPVTAWMPLPHPYQPERKSNVDIN